MTAAYGIGMFGYNMDLFNDWSIDSLLYNK